MRLAAVQDWRKRHKTVSDLATSLAIGIAVLIFLLVIQPPTLSIVRREADDTADKMIRLAERTATDLRSAPGYTFINIDERTWRAWKAPLITPRDRLSSLLARVVRSQPLAVILDVNLAYPGTPEGVTALTTFLQDYRPEWPPLMLVRSLIPPPGKGDALPEQRTTPYDDLIPPHPNVRWTVPLFERDSDGKVRRWRLIAPTCVDGHPEVLPSTHLAAAVLVRAIDQPGPAAAVGKPPAGWQQLDQRLEATVPPKCATAGTGTTATLADATPYAPPIVIDNADVRTRVLYSTAWLNDAVALGPLVQTPHGQSPLVAVRPALTVLSLPEDAPVPGLADRVVLIGGSYAESDDWHQTALGPMPGALMLFNAIDALARAGTPQEPSFAQQAGLSLVIIITVCLLTSLFRPIAATFVSSMVILLIMTISLSHFRSGVVLNLAVPAVAAALYDFGVSMIERGRGIWDEGWRWIFKPGSVFAKARINTDSGGGAPSKEAA